MEYIQQIEEATAFINDKLSGRKPKVGIILGSGLGGLAEIIEE